MTVADVGAVTETPVVFGRHDNLVGTLCRAPEAADRPFVVFLSSGIIHRTGPNRLYVGLARALAASGVSSFRFDLSGIGDSLIPRGAQAATIQERVREDVDDALEYVRTRHEADRVVLVGLCSGADNALRTMRRHPAVVGTVLLDINTRRTPLYWVHHYRRRVFAPRAWGRLLTGRHPTIRRLRKQLSAALSGEQGSAEPSMPEGLAFDAWLSTPELREHVQGAVDRGGQLLCVFTAGLEGQYNYRNQFFHLCRGVDFRDRLAFEFYGDSDHTFSDPRIRGRLVDRVVRWMGTTEFADAADSRRD